MTFLRQSNDIGDLRAMICLDYEAVRCCREEWSRFKISCGGQAFDTAEVEPRSQTRFDGWSSD